ncbi:FAD-binding oxidoreductase [Schumannella luteola]|uniref:Sarcosine oxidase n=1 Tax=Schumannella luteola TaxID=472059 RepID=A0A852YBD4_9MICO|nr:FAD-dependent oxidoreductase [Schumannella luteola]NYG99843.1 sarcosine oxidase [Schumannella luteola]TPX02222.1 FAD-dependent oxidoreductase [Schumannella luteola]
MKVVVIGGGAWGLPTAAELASRGHSVHLVDRYGIGNALASSSGPSRIWRIGDPDPRRVRLGRRGIAALERLQGFADAPLFRRQGMLWRHPESAAQLVRSARAEALDFELVAAERVPGIFPGLRDDGRDAVLLPDAGTLVADRVLETQLARFRAAGGRLSTGRYALSVERRPTSPRIRFADGTHDDADAIVIAAGPGAKQLLESLDLPAPLHTHLEQVVHFPTAPEVDGDALPVLFDGPRGEEPGIYAMPSLGVGYKIGLDGPLRAHSHDDTDRTPSAERTELLRARVARDFGALVPEPLDAQVCSWTDTPDGDFVLDAVGDGIVIGCGDVGEGFKYSALMGLVLADFVDGLPQDDDVLAYGIRRFGPAAAQHDFSEATRIGQHADRAASSGASHSHDLRGRRDHGADADPR